MAWAAAFPFRLNRNGGSFCFDSLSSREPVFTPHQVRGAGFRAKTLRRCELGIRHGWMTGRRCSGPSRAKHFARHRACESRGRGMREEREAFDYDRYRQLIVEAVDETRRMALINLLIEERARDRLAATLAADRAAATAMRIADVLGRSRS
jgi:hypothetical protein